MITTKVPAFISDELRKGERISWIGQPDKIWIFRLTSPLMLLALFIAVCMRHHVDLQYHGIIDLFVWGIDFFKFAPVFAFAVAPLFFCRLAARTYYVITDQRVITVNDGSRRKYQSVDRKEATPSMRMNILGRTLVRWDAPGWQKDSDGQTSRNGVVWQGLHPDDVARMGVTFPDYRTIAGQNTFK